MYNGCKFGLFKARSFLADCRTYLEVRKDISNQKRSLICTVSYCVQREVLLSFWISIIYYFLATNMAHRSGLIRSFSMSDIESTERIHEYVSDQEKGIGNRVPNLTRDVTRSSMVMPTLGNVESERARERVYKAVINIDSLHDMEMERSINWMSFSRNLLPMRTLGDGNCLLHSASLYMWGVHDRNLTLRRLLEKRLNHENPTSGKLFSRWRRAHELEMRTVPLNVTMAYSEYERDWNTIVTMASSKILTGRPGPQYCPLESIHIFALCNILARPIIVLSDAVYRGHTMGNIQQCKIGGIYIPLLRHETECEKSPIVIGYGHGHFEPLISSEDLEISICGNHVSKDAQHCIPLTYHNLDPLPVHFLTEEEEDCKHKLLEIYLELSSLPYAVERYNTTIQGEKNILCAMITFRPPPAWTIQLMWNLFSEVEKMEDSEAHNEASELNQVKSKQMCVLHSSGCRNVGQEHLNGLCPACYNKFANGRESPAHDLHNHVDIKRLKTTTANALPIVGGVNVEERPLEGEAVVNRAAKCYKPGCSNVGISKLYGLCYDCYTREVTSESVSPWLDRHAAGDYVNLRHAVPTGRGHVSLGSADEILLPAALSSVSLESSAVPLPVDPILPPSLVSGVTMDLQPNRVIPSPQIQTTIGNYATTSSGSHPGIVSSQGYPYSYPQIAERPQMYGNKEKYLCAIPGCNSPPQSGSDLCSVHEKVKECNTEGCKNSVFADEFGICESCLQEQQIALYRQEEKKRSTKDVSRVTSQPSNSPQRAPVPSTFRAPSVYSGYPGPRPGVASPTRKTPSVGEGRPSPFTASAVRKCVVPVCDKPAEREDGMCGSCGTAVDYYHNAQRISTKCLTPSCKKEGKEQYNKFCEECYSHINYETPLSTSSMYLPGHVSYNDTAPGSSMYSVADTKEGQLSPKPCLIETCKGIGMAIYAGLCPSCYESNLKLEKALALQKRPENKAVKKVSSEIYQFIPCKTVGCPSQGVPAQDMLCNHCYTHRNATMALDTSVNVKCKAKDCIFFGATEFNGYCSKCFIERLRNEADTPGNSLRQMGSRGQAPARSQSPEREVHESSEGLFGADQIRKKACRQPGCTMFGSPEKNGYCSQCWRLEYMKDDFIFIGNRDLVRD